MENVTFHSYRQIRKKFTHHTRLVFENLCCTVALMHVQVDHK